MRKYGFIFLLAVLLILSSSSTTSETTTELNDFLVESPEQSFIESYTTHGAINIDNDTHFDVVATAEGWAGFGNSSHPYIIEGYNITSGGTNIYINTTRHFIIRNCYLQADTSPFNPWGVYVLYSPNAQIENVTVFEKAVGFYFYQADNLVMTESKADSCDNGFYFQYSDNMDISEIETTDCTQYGIIFGSSDFVTIDTGSVSGPGERGITIHDSDYVTLTNIEVYDFTYEGVRITDSNYCALENTTIYSCGDNSHYGFHCTNSNYFTATNITAWDLAQGFFILDSFQPIIEDSYILSGTQSGIIVNGCSNLVIRRTQTAANGNHGILVQNSPSTLIENVESANNTWEGISIWDSPDCTIRHSTIDHNGISAGSGVYVLNSINLILFNNSISYNNNDDGLLLENSNYATITENFIHNNHQFGVYLATSSHCTLDNNSVYLNGDHGIRLSGSSDAILIDLMVYNNTANGIIASTSHRVNITNCDVYFNGDQGIDIQSTDDAIVSHCRIYYNDFFGIRTVQADRVEISFCDIYWNFYDGLYMQNTDDGVVSYNDFWENGGNECEITLDHTENALILENTLTGNRDSLGIYTTWSNYANITGNTISGNLHEGLNIQNSNFTFIASNTISNNGDTGVYLWASDNCAIIDNIIVGNDNRGVFISDCQYLTLTNNDISLSRYEGVYCTDSDYLVMENNNIFDNGWIDFATNPKSGVFITQSDFCELSFNNVYNNTVHGLYLHTTNDCILTNNTIYGNLGMTGPGCGIYFYYANRTIISNNTIYENFENGIYGAISYSCQILDNTIYSNHVSGISAYQSVSWIIQGNEIWDSQILFGIQLEGCVSFVIDSNLLYENANGGIRFSNSHFCNFTNNLVHHNPVFGVHLIHSNATLIYGNIIYDNYQWGLLLEYAGASRIYNNDFVLNVLDDAVERLSTYPNYWDDGISLGNYWWGISRTLDSYTIYDEIANPTNQDNYPMCSMWIEDASAISFEITSTGNIVEWEAFAFNPTYYEVYADGTLFFTDVWDGMNITVILDGLPVGSNDIEIVIYHFSGNNLTAIIVATVEDTTDPTWLETPQDQTINFGDSLSYQLLATDASPLGTWSVNNTQFSIVDGLLTNSVALDVGDYNLLITVQDIYGNELSVNIVVHVLPVGTDTTTSGTSTPIPIDPGTILVIIVGAGGVVVVIIIIVVIKKKSG